MPQWLWPGPQAPAAVTTDLETIYQGEFISIYNGEGEAGSGQGGLSHTVLPACSYPRLSKFRSFKGTFPTSPSSSILSLVPQLSAATSRPILVCGLFSCCPQIIVHRLA